jgi:hypothetical protein
MLAGIYGMNFRFMPELDWDFGYEFANRASRNPPNGIPSNPEKAMSGF